MGGRIYTTVNGHKYEVIFGSYVVKFIRIQTGIGVTAKQGRLSRPQGDYLKTAKQGRLSRPQGDYLKATTPVNTPVRELKNYL